MVVEYPSAKKRFLDSLSKFTKIIFICVYYSILSPRRLDATKDHSLQAGLVPQN